MKNVLIFFPHNPWPPQTGAHKRCLEIAGGLKELGCRVSLASSPLSSHTEWTTAGVESLKEFGFDSVDLYQPTDKDRRFIERLKWLYNSWNIPTRVLRKSRLLPATPPPNNGMLNPPGMRRWFARLVDAIKPDGIMMNYAYWDGLIDHRRHKSVTRMIDTIDFVSLNQEMQGAVRQLLPTPLSAEKTPDEVLREDFFERLSMTPDPREFDIFDQYDYSIAIASSEGEIIRQNSPRTRVALIQMTHDPYHMKNNYSGAALFPLGPNLFNIQGYLYFAKKVLPVVRREEPAFALTVTGTFYNNTPPEPVPNVTIKGFVPDLNPLYEAAPFVVCPVFGGTGQQVKIVEAMAHGVPVVALRAAADRSPMRHGLNGLVAENADEFAGHVIRLWRDRDLCRTLGEAARETITNEFSRARLLEGLSEVVKG